MSCVGCPVGQSWNELLNSDPRFHSAIVLGLYPDIFEAIEAKNVTVGYLDLHPNFYNWKHGERNFPGFADISLKLLTLLCCTPEKQSEMGFPYLTEAFYFFARGYTSFDAHWYGRDRYFEHNYVGKWAHIFKTTPRMRRSNSKECLARRPTTHELTRSYSLGGLTGTIGRMRDGIKLNGH